MRGSIDRFVREGGNVAYFSGNIDGWRIHFQDDDTAFTCAKVGPGPYDSDRWDHDANQAGNPENRTTGVAIQNAGGWWDGKRETVGYTVQHSRHWIYHGTGLADGDVFGADETLPLVGYECDGADFSMKDGLAIATGRQGTPSTFFILGIAELSAGWASAAPRPAATMGVYTSNAGGIVFQGATTDWPMVVGRNKEGARITRNDLDSLRLRAARILGPLPGTAGRLLVEEGATATFLVDISGISSKDGLHYSWSVSGGDIAGDVPTLDIQIPAGREPVTVSVTIADASGPIGFGTRTFLPMSHVDALRFEIVNLLREMATPGDPSGTFVMTTFDPLLISRGLVTVNLPWLRDRAKRLGEVTTELLEVWSQDGTRPVVPDPRRQ